MNVTDTRPLEIADETETWRERLAYWAYATIAWLASCTAMACRSRARRWVKR